MPYRDIKVLLVEDDVTLGALADARLSAKHFNVLRAPDKITAVGLLDGADILILDLHLPNGDGKELLRLWAKKLDVGPAIIITGYPVRDEDVSEAWSILRKPFDMDRLVEAIERYAIVVRGMRCCKEVASLKRRMNLMWIVIAGLGGYEVILPLAQKLLTAVLGG